MAFLSLWEFEMELIYLTVAVLAGVAVGYLMRGMKG